MTHSVMMAGFPKVKTLAEFDFEYQPSINPQQIYDLNSLRFLEKQENIIFYGNSGVGKTHLATAIGITAAQNRNSTYFIKCSELMETLHKAQVEGRFAERLKILWVQASHHRRTRVPSYFKGGFKTVLPTDRQKVRTQQHHHYNKHQFWAMG